MNSVYPAEGSNPVYSVPTRSRRTIGLTAIAIVLGIFQTAQLINAINRYAVDVPFWDQWDFYDAFFKTHGLWEIFSWQHGPHRQGAGFFLIWATNELTGWDQRAQAFMIGVVMVAAAVAALWLKRRLFGSLQWYDAIPVLMILSLKSWEIYFNTPNVSHGALPLLLVILAGIAWTAGNLFLRYTLVVAMNFLALFTGFGVFVGLITPILLIIDCLHAVRGRKWQEFSMAGGALLCSMASIGLYFHNYVFQSAADCFRFPDQRWYLYPIFMAIEFAVLISPGSYTSFLSKGIGLIAEGMLLYMLAASALRLRHQGDHYQRYRVIFFLLAFSIIFAANAAVGRLCLGMAIATSPRYVPLILPGVIGAYLFLLSRPKWAVRKLVMLILLCATILTAVIPWQVKRSEGFRKGKAAWVQAYRLTGDIARADVLSGYRIYPEPARTELDRKLDWLRLHNYSLFRRR